MADDDLFGGKPLTEGTNAATDATKSYTKSVEANLSVMDKWANRHRQMQEEAKDLSKIWQEQKDELRKWTQSMYGAEASVQKMTGSLKNAHNWLNKNIGLMATYNRLLGELRQGQDLFAKSGHASVVAQATASKEMQKSINLVRESKKAAHDMAAEYGLAQKDMAKITEGVNKTFHTQIRQSVDYKGHLRDLSKDILLVSKRFGVDGAEAIKYMQSRMQASSMTMREAQTETMLVAKATEEYMEELRKIPGAFDRAYASQQVFYQGMAKANEAFRLGNLDAAGYAQQLKFIMLRAEELGLTTNQVTNASQGLAKVMKGLQDENLGSIFSLKGVQNVADLRAKIEELGDETAKKKLEVALKLSEGMAAPDQYKLIIEQLAGTRTLTSLTLKHLRELGDNKSVIKALVEQYGVSNTTAALIVQNLEGLQQSLDKKKEGEGEANAFRSALDSSVKEFGKADSPQYRLVLEIQKGVDALTNWLKYEGFAAIGLIVTQTALQYKALKKSYNLQKRGGRLETSQLKYLVKIHRAIRAGGGGGGGVGGGRGSRGSRRGRRVKGAKIRRGGRGRAGAALDIAGAAGIGLPGAAGAALDLAGTAASFAPAGMLAKGGALAKGALAKGAAVGGIALKTAGVAAAAYVGYKFGQYLDKEFDLSNKASKGLFKAVAWAKGGKTEEAVKEIEGALPLSQRMSKDMLKKYQDSLSLLKKFNQMQIPLNESQRKLRDEARAYVAQYKQGWRAHIKNVKEAGKTYKKEQLEDVAGGLSSADFEKAKKLKDPKARARMLMERLVGSSRRIYTQASGAGALQKVLTGDYSGLGVMGTARAMSLREKLQQAGISPEMALQVGKEELLKTQRWAYKGGQAGADLQKKFQVEEAMQTMAQYGRMKSGGMGTVSPEMLQKVQAARQTLVKLGIDENMVKRMKDAQSQQGDYKVQDKSMTYNVTIPLKMDLEQMWSGLVDAANIPGANNSTSGTV